jgi:hypothetical protein
MLGADRIRKHPCAVTRYRPARRGTDLLGDGDAVALGELFVEGSVPPRHAPRAAIKKMPGNISARARKLTTVAS